MQSEASQNIEPVYHQVLVVELERERERERERGERGL